MTQPTRYVQATDFSQEEADGVAGRSTVRTAMVDAELSALGTTLGQICDNLAILQRDDTQLRDGIVKIHTLSPEVLALIASGAFRVRGAWLTATIYAVGDVVLVGAATYVCMAAHTSGTFATDLTAGKWGEIGAAFVAPGVGGVTRTVSSALGAIVRSGDYDTTPHFNTARDALTETIGVKTLQVGTSALASSITFPSRTAGRGPQALYAFDATFNGTVDPSINVGYNLGPDSIGGEPQLGMAMEGNYDDGSGQNKMEWYVQFSGLTGQGAEVRRPFFCQANRATSTLFNTYNADSHSFQSRDAAAATTWLQISSSGLAVGGTDLSLDIGTSGHRPKSIITPTIDSGAAASVDFKTNNGTRQFEVAHVANAVNRVQIFAGTTGQPAYIGPQGESNISMGIFTSGTGDVKFQLPAGSNDSLRILYTASVTRWMTITGSNGGNPSLGVSAGALNLGGGADLQWGKALVALGGGAAPTLGTIGGTGPATAAQNSWMRVLDSTGAAFWVPAWK